MTTARPPTGMLPRLQTSVCVSEHGDPWLVLLVPGLTDEGRASVTLTAWAVVVPTFFTVIV